MTRIILSLLIAFSAITTTAQQNVGIGTNTPAASAQLEVTASNKGFLPPRIALTGTNDIATIASPATGLLIYNTATAGIAPNNVLPGYYYYTGTVWQPLGNTTPIIVAVPGVITTAVSSVTGDAAVSGGNVIADGGALINARGICISTTINPTISNTVIAATTTGPGTFTTDITGLTPATSYYARAYATNANGTGYGANYTFTTQTAFVPNVATYEASNITLTSARIRAQVVNNGNATITASGVCYSTDANPTIANSVVSSNTTQGVFYCNLTGLTQGTLYHVRAYATNIMGTSYGADSTFTTTGFSAPTVTTGKLLAQGSSFISLTGTVSYNGGSAITERGFCFDTTANPAITGNNTVISGTSLGGFSGAVTGLLSNKLYHIRAYATNATGTAYGRDTSFTTLSNAGEFIATFNFDSVKTNSGLIDPGFQPSIDGVMVTPFKVVGVNNSNSVAAGRFSFSDWTLGATNGSDVFTAAEDSLGKYYEITLTPQPGRLLGFRSIRFTVQRSGAGPRQYFIRTSHNFLYNSQTISINPANANLSVYAAPTTFSKFQIADNAIGAPQYGSILNYFDPSPVNYPVIIRIYCVNAEGYAGTFSIDDVEIQGTVQ